MCELAWIHRVHHELGRHGHRCQADGGKGSCDDRLTLGFELRNSLEELLGAAAGDEAERPGIAEQLQRRRSLAQSFKRESETCKHAFYWDPVILLAPD